MTDDQILEAARVIRLRLFEERRMESFPNAKNIMIRWDNSTAVTGESYTSIYVTKEDVQEIVTKILQQRIDDLPTPHIS